MSKESIEAAIKHLSEIADFNERNAEGHKKCAQIARDNALRSRKDANDADERATDYMKQHAFWMKEAATLREHVGALKALLP